MWANRIMGSSLQMRSRIKPKILASYLSTLVLSDQARAAHSGIPFAPTQTTHTQWEVLLSFVKSSPPLHYQRDSICNLDKCPYQQQRIPMPCESYIREIRALPRLVPKPDISFSEFDQYVTMRIKRRKTDAYHSRVLIIIAAARGRNFHRHTRT